MQSPGYVATPGHAVIQRTVLTSLPYGGPAWRFRQEVVALLSAYDFATRSLVLTYHMLLPGQVTEGGSGLRWTPFPIVLDVCYAVRGTEIGYGGTRRRSTEIGYGGTRRASTEGQEQLQHQLGHVCSYTRPTRCPVLCYAVSGTELRVCCYS
eukprot:3391813-Rhodomonas_salina.1